MRSNGLLTTQKQTPKVELKPQVRPTIIDPAIVSFEKRKPPQPNQCVTETRNGHDKTNSHVNAGQTHKQTKGSGGPYHTMTAPMTTLNPPALPSCQTQPAAGQDHKATIPTQTSATLTEPFSQLSLDTSAVREDPQATPVRKEFLEPKTSFKRNRPGKNARKKNTGGDFVQFQASPHLAPPPKAVKARNGRQARQQRTHQAEQIGNGWATEEVSDIQEMGDFDFQQNLSKFDKRRVFDEIRQGDTTAEEDRLHTFNRTPKPGTANGKNLHHTEMVLGSPKQVAVDISSADDEIERNSSRRGSDRTMRKALPRRPLSRPRSHLNSSEAHMTGSGSLPDIQESRPMSRVSSSRSAIRTAHPRSRRTSAQYAMPKSSLTYAGTDRICPTLTPLQMLELEQLAISEYGLTPEIITENAARAIADAALDLCPFPRTAKQPGDTPPLITILAGNTQTGARAIAAARHLRNRGAKVVVCILGLEREESLLESVRRQISIYQVCDGRVVAPSQLQRTFTRVAGGGGRTHPAGIIVDALLGMHLAHDDLGPDDQTAYGLLVKWWREQSTYLSAMSIDVPSGIDATTGVYDTSVPAGGEIVGEKHVLCLGAPKPGVIACFDEDTGDKGRVWVADIGIPNTAWRRFGNKPGSGRGVMFGGRGIVEVKAVPGG